MGWWKNYRASKEKSDEAFKTAEQALARVERQRPVVHAVTSYLADRNARNGFGEDIELTLVPRSSR